MLVNKADGFLGGPVVLGRSLFYHERMDWTGVWSVLRWVLAALVAGFICQFGKSLALYLIQRRRRRRQADAQSQAMSQIAKIDDSARSDSEDVQAVLAKQTAKVEKKRAKAEVKRLKKS